RTFDFSLPAIVRDHAGQDVDAGREPPLDQRTTSSFRIGDRRPGCIDEYRAVHSRSPGSAAPESLAGDLGALHHRLHLRPDDAGVDLVRAGKAGETAVGAGDDVLAPDEIGITDET